jgi:acetyl esterase/lipase
MPLWPGTPPGGEGVRLTLQVNDVSTTGKPSRLLKQIAVPDLTVYRPAKPDGSAVLVIAGGSYVCVVIDAEGTATAQRLNAAGVTAFVLTYRLPSEGWADGANVPLQDAQRAMRLIRANAARFAIDPARLGILGFSAGGHLAASLATRFDEAVYAPVDDVDRQDARPAFAGLVYPVITMGEGTHIDSRKNLLGSAQSPARIAAYSCEKRVTSRTSPCYLCVGGDDALVPAGPNSVGMYKALVAAGVPAEMHAFQKGAHGFAMHADHDPGGLNAEMFLRWGARGGWFKDPGAAV